MTNTPTAFERLVDITVRNLSGILNDLNDIYYDQLFNKAKESSPGSFKETLEFIDFSNSIADTLIKRTSNGADKLLVAIAFSNAYKGVLNESLMNSSFDSQTLAQLLRDSCGGSLETALVALSKTTD